MSKFISTNANTTFEVESPAVTYSESEIRADYVYETTNVEQLENGNLKVRPVKRNYTFKTDRKVPKTGVMFVGWGGNNGTTVTAGILANKKKLSWNTKSGKQESDYLGSLTQASTVRIGSTNTGDEVYIPFNSMLPMVHPNDLVIGGWDISGLNMGDAMRRSEVLHYGLQEQIYEEMAALKPLPSIYYPDFIAANQSDRADNVLEGTKAEHLEKIRQDIRDFKESNGLDKVIILWTANTERFCDIRVGLNDTADNLLASIKNNEDEVSASTVFAVASILEGCTYINGSPQNTFVPGVVELAKQKDVFIAGDDFKTGQTKIKSVLVDFLVSAGIKPEAIVSYNHLGNNDGKNLSSARQFRSKEISKSNVVDDMVSSNSLMFGEDEHPDHCVVIKYVPYVKDSKRAMDEYTSRIFMGGHNTIVLHNTCEDSLLAAPLIIDLVILAELCERIQYKTEEMNEFEGLDSILSILSFLIKAPLVPSGSPVINAFFKQRSCMVNIFRACVGLAPENDMLLEHKIQQRK